MPFRVSVQLGCRLTIAAPANANRKRKSRIPSAPHADWCANLHLNGTTRTIVEALVLEADSTGTARTSLRQLGGENLSVPRVRRAIDQAIAAGHILVRPWMAGDDDGQQLGHVFMLIRNAAERDASLAEGFEARRRQASPCAAGMRAANQESAVA